ncbi:MAG: hypothetical protein WCJ30_20065, partial [Deltaproteobacteria bacterium]
MLFLRPRVFSAAIAGSVLALASHAAATLRVSPVINLSRTVTAPALAEPSSDGSPSLAAGPGATWLAWLAWTRTPAAVFPATTASAIVIASFDSSRMLLTTSRSLTEDPTIYNVAIAHDGMRPVIVYGVPGNRGPSTDLWLAPIDASAPATRIQVDALAGPLLDLSIASSVLPPVVPILASFLDVDALAPTRRGLIYRA